MRIRTILAAAAAPAALAAVLLGTAGQASAATTASSSDVSAYYWNPNGHALGGPQAMGPVSGAHVLFSQSQYLAKVTEKLTGQNQNLLGKREGLKQPLDRAEALAEAKRWLRSLSTEEADKALTALSPTPASSPSAATS